MAGPESPTSTRRTAGPEVVPGTGGEAADLTFLLACDNITIAARGPVERTAATVPLASTTLQGTPERTVPTSLQVAPERTVTTTQTTPEVQVRSATTPTDGRTERTATTITDAEIARINPSLHFQQVAFQKSQELKALLTANLKPDGTLNVSPELTRQVQELQQLIGTSLTSAVTAADNPINKALIASAAADFTRTGKDQQLLLRCNEFRLDPDRVSLQDIQELQRNARGEVLAGLRELEQLLKLQNACKGPSEQAMARLECASILSTGLLNPDMTKLGREVPQTDVVKANQYLHDARNLDPTNAVVLSREFAGWEQHVHALLSRGTTAGGTATGDSGTAPGGTATGDRTLTTSASVNDSTPPGGGTVPSAEQTRMQQLEVAIRQAHDERDPSKQEAAYQKAADLANDIARSTLPHLISNFGQQPADVQEQTLKWFSQVQGAREDFAKYLLDRPQHQRDDCGKAIGLLSQVRADVGMLDAGFRAGTPDHAAQDRLRYLAFDQNSRTALTQLTNRALNGNATMTDDPDTHMRAFKAAMDRKEYATAFDEVKKAQRAAAALSGDIMRENRNVLRDQIRDMRAELTDLNSGTQVASLDRRRGPNDPVSDASPNSGTRMSEQDKAVRKGMLENEIASLEQMAMIGQTKRNVVADLIFREAQTLIMQDQRGAAFPLLKQFRDTEYYRNLTSAQRREMGYNLENSTGPDGKPVPGLLDGCDPDKQPGWLARNAYWLAPVAAVGVGALTFWMGPGALVTSSATAAAILSAGAGIGLGTAAYCGIKMCPDNIAGVKIGGPGESFSGEMLFDGIKWSATGVMLAAAAPAPRLLQVAVTRAAPAMGARMAAPALGARLATAVGLPAEVSAGAGTATRWGVPLARTAITGSLVTVPYTAMDSGQQIYNGANASDVLLHDAWAAPLQATGGPWISATLPLITGAEGSSRPGQPRGALMGGIQNYYEVRRALHGPLDPNADRDAMAGNDIFPPYQRPDARRLEQEQH